MIQEEPKGGFIIMLSLIVAMALTILPLPDSVDPYRPEWVVLVLLYWIMALPHRLGVSIAWLLGICLDILKGALLGQHAMAIAIVAYLMLKMHQRVRVYPYWQQAIMVGSLLLLYQALLLWIYGLTGTLTTGWPYWLPSLTGTVLWPWLFVLMRDVRRRYKVR
jgi:rod shape-determining protein MreD